MANEKHLDIIKQGVAVWNEWRKNNSEIKPDLSMVDLRGTQLNEANLMRANFSGANLSGTDLRYANLWKAYLNGANLSEANLYGADLSRTNLSNANLCRAILCEVNLWRANLSGANLKGADLRNANLDLTNFRKATLTDCKIYGISAWNLDLEGATQSGLIITSEYEFNIITVENLEVAQFIHLLLHNEKIRDVIDTITSRVVLILGRFKHERKVILDALREELRKRNYSPVIFDFEKPGSRSLTDTVTLLARMSRFIIADVSDPKSVPHELYAIVPTLKSVPVQLILDRGSRGYPMVVDILDYPQVIEEICLYDNLEELLGSLKEKVINPAESRAKELEERRNKIEEKYKELEKELKNES